VLQTLFAKTQPKIPSQLNKPLAQPHVKWKQPAMYGNMRLLQLKESLNFPSFQQLSVALSLPSPVGM
jgi:hypothetical protein